MKNIITLLSDWRLRDPYIAMLKGKIFQSFPDASIIDITHYIDKFDILQTSIVMKGAYKSFPDNSVHLLLTNTTFLSNFTPVLLKFDNHYFISEDNGFFRLMFGQDEQLVGLTLNESTGSSISDMLKMVEYINDGTIEEKCSEYTNFKWMFVELPVYSEESRTIEGKIVYVDAFNNAITDISADKFMQLVGDKSFNATIQSAGEWHISQFSNDYKSMGNEMYLSRNELGLIEITTYQADTAILADLSPFDKIIINF